MKSDIQLRLFMVNHPIPFKSYGDHAEALRVQLEEMIENALNQGEEPEYLIEGYLDVDYTGGESSKEIADFLLHTPYMVYAMHMLRDNWNQIDTSLPEDSLMYGGISKEQAREVFTETSLHSYLEALAGIYDDTPTK